MLKIALYAQLSRTFTPCTGVGRHCNEIGLALTRRADVNATLLVSNEYCSKNDGLPQNAPLRALNRVVYLSRERHLEQFRKLTGRPVFDRILPERSNWLYCPHDTRLNSNRCRTAITIHDARMFEPGLTGSNWRDRVADRVMRAWMRKAANDANLVFTVTDFSKQRLCELLHLSPKKVVSVGNGLPHSFGSQKTLSTEGKNDLRSRESIVVMGGLRYIKGGDRVIKLAKALMAINSEIKIISVGGPDEPDLSAEADDLPNIVRLGFIDDDALVELVSKALTTLHCSRYEGFGLPALESMSLGIPVIAQNETSLPEVVGDGGLLIDTDNTSEIIELLEKLRSDQSFVADLRVLGRTQAAKYNWDDSAARVCAAMNEYDAECRNQVESP